MLARICEMLEVNESNKLVSTEFGSERERFVKRIRSGWTYRGFNYSETYSRFNDRNDADRERFRRTSESEREARGSKSPSLTFLPGNRRQRSHHPDNMLIS